MSKSKRRRSSGNRERALPGRGNKPGGVLPFPATRKNQTFVADHPRPAAKKAGVQIEDGQRFGLHNLRHSLSNWLVNKAKVEPKTVQGILRHSRIQTTLDLYTQKDSDEARAAQGEFLRALGMQSELVQ
jgi:integrase